MAQKSPHFFRVVLAIAPLLFFTLNERLLWGRALPAAFAQIVPDTTLPNDSTAVFNGDSFIIDGGTTAGTNLFHSFSEFSVPAGAEAFFNNAFDIQNILTRVTGNNISNIDGLLRANGLANLFLLNPNGIIFGPDARLDIGGSFMGSTAESLQFADGLEFGATAGAIRGSPLLSIDVPVGLQFGPNSGAIAVRGNGISESVPTDNFGLTVAPGQTFALAGSDIRFAGGIVTAPSGRIEAGSVRDGEVALVRTPAGFELNYDGVTEFGNIELVERSSLFSPAIVDNPNSEINVAGDRIVLDGSQIVSLTNGSADSGRITVRASESLALGGTATAFPFISRIVTQVAEGATGNGGEVAIAAPQIAITDGARVRTLSLGSGAAGNARVEADTIFVGGSAVIGANLLGFAPASIFETALNSRIASENLASGAGGNVEVVTGALTLVDGGQITSRVATMATGDGGNVTVSARDITGTGVDAIVPAIFSGIGSYALADGAAGNPKGGDVTVAAERVTLDAGAAIFSIASGRGRGGDATIRVSESIVAREVNAAFPLFTSGIFLATFGSGDGGSVHISTGRLALFDGAGATLLASSQGLGGFQEVVLGTGNTGNLAIAADTVELVGVSALDPQRAVQLGTLTLSAGNAGNVNLSTRTLSVRDGATLVSAVFSLGLDPRPAAAGSGHGR